ncbi:MAG: hypothetical protein AAGA65_16970 [Actinomycetota bacterium]
MTTNLSRELEWRWRSVAVLTVGAIASLAVLIWAVANTSASPTVAGQAVDQAVENDDPTKLDNDGRFTGPGDVWPPQPRSATAMIDRSAVDFAPMSAADRLLAIDGAAPAGRAPSEVLAADDNVLGAIGESANLIAVEEVDGATHLAWFSLSNNQTVEVVVKGDRVTSLVTSDPTVFQPELSHAEKLAAVDVARAHWVGKGDRRIDGLEGFSILAFQPGGAYYDTRMVYVSFHVDEDARPELLAWVDLVTGDVIKSEVDR